MEDQETNPEVQEVPNKEANMYDVMFGSADTNPEQASTEQPQEEEPLILSEQSQEAEEEVYEEVEEVEVSDEEEYEETPQSYTVKVDGEEFEVTLDELTSGYQRQSDYTRKSQSVAEMRKTYEANVQSVQQEREKYSQVLANMEQYQNLELQKFNDIDWASLKEDDPVEYMEKRIDFQDAKEKASRVQEERRSAYAKTQQEVHQSVQQTLQAEGEKLATVLPEYSDPSSNLKTELRDFALGMGFTEQDVNSIADHKVVLVLHKAYLQDRANASKTSKVTKKSSNKVLKAGNPVGKTQRVNRDVKARRDKLSKSGSKQDAVNAFMDLI
tara:strand:- start:311 stop:1291 length:981 start_codon:yes stop_codon:yes gene_type:complete